MQFILDLALKYNFLTEGFAFALFFHCFVLALLLNLWSWNRKQHIFILLRPRNAFRFLCRCSINSAMCGLFFFFVVIKNIYSYYYSLLEYEL